MKPWTANLADAYVLCTGVARSPKKLPTLIDRAGAPALAEVPHRGERAVDDAPVRGVEHPVPVGHRHLPGPAEDRDPGVVDPGVDPAEFADRGFRRAVDVLLFPHVADDVIACPP